MRDFAWATRRMLDVAWALEDVRDATDEVRHGCTASACNIQNLASQIDLGHTGEEVG